jgi:hypothetical protein
VLSARDNCLFLFCCYISVSARANKVSISAFLGPPGNNPSAERYTIVSACHSIASGQILPNAVRDSGDHAFLSVRNESSELIGLQAGQDTPTSRATSSTFRPASNCFSAPIISASVCLLFDIPLPLSFVRNHTQLRSETGDQVTKNVASQTTTEYIFKAHVGKSGAVQTTSINTRELHDIERAPAKQCTKGMADSPADEAIRAQFEAQYGDKAVEDEEE